MQDLQTNPVLTLRGPRRVGKTVAMKLFVAELIENEGWDPRSIVWLNFDTVRTMAQAEEILLTAIEPRLPQAIFIDEITALIGWQRVIKKLRDTTKLASTAILMTGSSAYDLRAGAERMAGRRGTVDNPDRALLPLSLLEFAEQLAITDIKIQGEALQAAFLECGGFPFRVDQFIQSFPTGNWTTNQGLSVFDDILFFEIVRRRLDRNVLLEVVGRLAEIQPGAVSYEGFSKALSVAKDTARKYLQALGDAFLLATVSAYDTARNRVAPKKDRKLVWVDPAFGLMAEYLGQGKRAISATQAEWVVGVELLRCYEHRLWEGLSSPRNVFTWRSSSGKEIDYLVIDKSKALKFPVEVKFQSSVSDWDFQVMERAFGTGLLVTAGTSYTRLKSKSLDLLTFAAELRSEI